MSHASHWAIINVIRSVTQIATTSRRGKVVTFKPKILSLYTTELSYTNFFPQKIDQIFGFWAGLKLSRNTCFCGFKSSLVVKSYLAKHERLAFSNGAHMTTSSGQSPCGVSIKF